jgi:hypothetical protein
MLKEGSSLLLGAGPARVKMHKRKIMEMLASVTLIPMICPSIQGKPVLLAPDGQIGFYSVPGTARDSLSAKFIQR